MTYFDKPISERLHSNPYSLLDIEAIQDPFAVEKKQKPKMVDSSTQTEEALIPKTELVSAEILKEAQVSNEPKKYEFQHLDFEVMKLDDETEYDVSLPEMEPYLEEAGDRFVQEQSRAKNPLYRAFYSAEKALYWTASSVANYMRTSFTRTENEVLRAMCDPTNEIRVTNSWFFGGGRERLYMISHRSAFQNAFFNTPKWLWFEGLSSIFTSEQTNVLNIYKIFPHVLKDRISSLESKLSTVVEDLAKKAVTVLNDEEYDNMDYLAQLEGDLKKALHSHLQSTSELIIHNQGEIKTGMKKVQIALQDKIEKNFPDGGSFITVARDKIDNLKAFSDRFFKIGDSIAQGAIESHNRVIDETLDNFRGNTLEARKGRVYLLTRELLQLRAEVKKHLERFATTIEDFTEILSDY